jgi:signal transduction histidine kinase
MGLRYFLEFPAGACSAAAIFITAGKAGPAAFLLRAGALFLAGQAVLGVFFPPPVPFPPADTFNADLFQALAGFRLELPRGVLVACAAAAVWAAHLHPSTEEGTRKAPGYGVRLSGFLALFAVISLGGLMLVDHLGDHERANMDTDIRLHLSTVRGVAEGAPEKLQPLMTAVHRGAPEDHLWAIVDPSGVAILSGIPGILPGNRLWPDPSAAVPQWALFPAPLAGGTELTMRGRLWRTGFDRGGAAGRSIVMLHPAGRVLRQRLFGICITAAVFLLALLVYEATDRLSRYAIRLAESESRAAIESSRLKSEFLATMSHEIRTPMNGVIGMLDLAVDAGTAPAQREYLEIARTSAERMVSMTDSILDFSRLESGRTPLEAVPFSLDGLLGESLELPSSAAARKGLDLVVARSPGVPDRLIGDPFRIGQVLVNLVGNAVKFTERGSVKVEIGSAAAGSGAVTVTFRVADTGIGIPASRREAVFEPFTQVDGAITRKYGGTGLGLAIARGHAEGMGGTLRLEGGEGRGSVFTFSVPLEVDQGGDAAGIRKKARWVT